MLVFGVDPPLGEDAHLLPLLQPHIDILLGYSSLPALLIDTLYFIHLFFHLLLLILQNDLPQKRLLFLAEPLDVLANHGLILVCFDLPAIYPLYQTYPHLLFTVSLVLLSHQQRRIVLNDESDHHSDILGDVVHPVHCDLDQFAIELQGQSRLNLI